MLTSFSIRSIKSLNISILFISFTWLTALASPVHADPVLTLHLAAKPFSPTMCKGYGTRASIRIRTANHRTLEVKKVPGQYKPNDADQARQKNYVHFITIADLSNGKIKNGSIAFDVRHSVIYDKVHPKGISRPSFVAQHVTNLRPLVDQALDTFLYIQPILNAAIDTCRPYPAKAVYETTDEILRIETGKLTYLNLVHRHNTQPRPKDFIIPHEDGNVEGFVNPDAGKLSNMSYRAMNPLNFYVPTLYP
ncbi:MAG: hypothetical protein ACPGYT_07925 [Nitrospirales bacterium]